MHQVHNYTLAPDDLDLFTFFNSDPVEMIRNEGYWCYQYSDDEGIAIRFSCNALAKSVQTILIVGGREVEVVVHECAEEIKIAGDLLVCSFSQRESTKLEIKLRPAISIKWSTLRVN